MYEKNLRPVEELPFTDSSEKNNDVFLEAEEAFNLRHKCKTLEHDLFYLWVFLCSQELTEDAYDFLEEHHNDCVPFHL